MILGQLRMGARQAKNASLGGTQAAARSMLILNLDRIVVQLTISSNIIFLLLSFCVGRRLSIIILFSVIVIIIIVIIISS